MNLRHLLGLKGKISSNLIKLCSNFLKTQIKWSKTQILRHLWGVRCRKVVHRNRPWFLPSCLPLYLKSSYLTYILYRVSGSLLIRLKHENKHQWDFKVTSSSGTTKCNFQNQGWSNGDGQQIVNPPASILSRWRHWQWQCCHQQMRRHYGDFKVTFSCDNVCLFR